jgi:spore coat polysaccharide biosynthesis protein SpsF
VIPASSVTLRPATVQDCLVLWRWRNDPVTRQASLDDAPVPLEAHTRWLEDSLRRDDRRIYIVQAAEAEVGMVRLDLSGSEATVSINISPEWRGQGVGPAALRTLCRQAFGSLALMRLIAQVKAVNYVSRAAFERAGFEVVGGRDPLVMARTGRLRVVAAIQARLGSRRLPGKVLRVVSGRPLIGWIVSRLCHAREVDAVVVSTSTAPADAALEKFAKSAGVGFFRGSEEDVLSRLLETSREFGADAIVRITGDCPLIDPAVVDLVTGTFRESQGRVEYVSNVYPSTFPQGLDVEVLSRELLERLDREIDDSFYRDWFSAFIREHPERFTMMNVANPVDLHELRWTVDYAEDLEFLGRLLTELGAIAEAAGMEEILAVLRRRPELRDINRHLEDSAIIRGIRSATYHRLLAERERAKETREARHAH